MAKIDIDYVELKNNYNYVNAKINELLTLIESLNADCQNLCEDGCWQGALSTSFDSIKSQMYKCAMQNILNFKETEEFKSVSIDSFKEAESTSSKDYV